MIIFFKSSKLLFGQIRSRHVNANKYNTFVKYKPFTNSVEGIQAWYCTCKNGSRTVGCCSHVSSLIYFFSFAKYVDFKSINQNIFLINK